MAIRSIIEKQDPLWFGCDVSKSREGRGEGGMEGWKEGGRGGAREEGGKGMREEGSKAIAESEGHGHTLDY
jgi:hypothetical protein